MNIVSWNTYLSPAQPGFYDRVDSVNRKLEEWDNKGVDVICLQEVFKWKIGFFSKFILLPLSQKIRTGSRVLLGLSIYDGWYGLSSIILLGICFCLMKKRMNLALVIVLGLLILQLVYFDYFSTSSLLRIPDAYKENTATSRLSDNTLLSGGLLTLSRHKIRKQERTGFAHGIYGVEYGFLRSIININDTEYHLHNLHLVATFDPARGIETVYGEDKSSYDSSVDDEKRKIRKRQIDELLSGIDPGKNNILVGDFNICKFYDGDEYNGLVRELKKYKILPIRVKNLDHRGLVPGGTHKSLDFDAPDAIKHKREFLDHSFASESISKEMLTEYLDYISGIDHRPMVVRMK